MGGGQRPGTAYKAKVISKSELSVTLHGKEASILLTVPADDVAYFNLGEHYIVAIHPVDSSNSVGGDCPES